jgi:hypothetical protein
MRYSQNFNIVYTSMDRGDGKGCFTSASSKGPELCIAKVGSKHIGGFVDYIIYLCRSSGFVMTGKGSGR